MLYLYTDIKTLQIQHGVGVCVLDTESVYNACYCSLQTTSQESKLWNICLMKVFINTLINNDIFSPFGTVVEAKI